MGVLTRGTAGVLRVGAFQSVSAELVPELIRRLPDAQPGLSVDLVQTTADTELFALLEEGRLDVTFAILPLPQGPFEAVELFADPIVLMVSTSSPLARRREPVGLEELAGLPLITSHDCRYLNGFEARMHERGYEPDVVHRTDDNGTLYGLIAGGVGAAVGTQLVADGAKGSVATLEIEEPLPPRRVALAWRRDREFRPGTRRSSTSSGRSAGTSGSNRRRPRPPDPARQAPVRLVSALGHDRSSSTGSLRLSRKVTALLGTIPPSPGTSICSSLEQTSLIQSRCPGIGVRGLRSPAAISKL